MRSIPKPCHEERLRLLADDLLPPAETASLEEHLQHCSHCRETLDQLIGEDRLLGSVRHYFASNRTEAPEESAPAGESLSFLAPSDWPGSLGRLGSYEVIGVLGRGGMGVVLKAYDPALRRNVAIKVLSAALASCGAARRRFLREARAAAAVVHEHVVSVFAVVETAGLPFFVMEYVPGRSLQDRLDRDGPLGLTEILRIGMQTAAGLAAAHAQGLVHRDVKPANSQAARKRPLPALSDRCSSCRPLGALPCACSATAGNRAARGDHPACATDRLWSPASAAMGGLAAGNLGWRRRVTCAGHLATAGTTRPEPCGCASKLGTTPRREIGRNDAIRNRRDRPSDRQCPFSRAFAGDRSAPGGPLDRSRSRLGAGTRPLRPRPLARARHRFEL